MDAYLAVKWLHVVSATILFGTGIGSAFYMLAASVNRDPRVAHFVVRWVVVADWAFTATAAIVQPLSGLYLAHLAKLPLTATWLWLSIALYLVAGACWLPVVWMQVRMRDMARVAMEQGGELPERYFRFLRVWVALGIPAFSSLVVVLYLMVARPG